MASPRRHDLVVIEDAAQGLLARLPRPAARRDRRTRPRSASTRRRTSSAARAARCSSTTARFVERAEIIREKGTNRSRFFRGQVDKYTWVDIGSSYLLERDHRRVPLGAARGGRRRSRRAASRSGTATTSAFADARGARAAAPAGRAGVARAQRAHVLRAAADARARATRSSRARRGQASTPSSTTCRCTARDAGRRLRSGARADDRHGRREHAPGAPAALGRAWTTPSSSDVIAAVESASR